MLQDYILMLQDNTQRTFLTRQEYNFTHPYPGSPTAIT